MKRININLEFLMIILSSPAIFALSLEVQLKYQNEVDFTTATETVTEFVEDTTEIVTVKANISEDNKPFLLPLAIKPIHYKLEILPLLFPVEDAESPYYNSGLFTAPGKVWIRVGCLEKTSNITLHAFQDMQIDSEKIQVTSEETGELIAIKNVSRDNETDFLVLHLLQPIGNDNGTGQIYNILIEFTSRIANDRLNGLYLDYYVNPETKEKRFVSTTLFAPNHARKAFPCFDEPGYKANFNISIGRKEKSGYSSISNMPLASSKPISNLKGWVLDEFQETVPLPTYLVALITTDFGYRQIKDGDLELRLHAPKYLINRIKTLKSESFTESNITKTVNPYLLQDPLHFIASALKMWKGTKLGSYPLSKLDIIALPHFYFSAMENLGAITFKYPVILNVENVTTTSELLRLSFVAGHEVAHTWFGTMMTPKSWTYVWLKESFSDLFARIFLSEKLNEVYQHEDFVNSELQRAMRYDGSADTHPLENHVKTASAVEGIYTDIPYRKGASIMNMVGVFLTEAVFKEGLESLFLEKKYSNVDQYDLFDHFEKAQKKHKILDSQGLPANITVTDILNTWTKQSGYPVVHLRKEGSKLILKQQKFKDMLYETLKASENSSSIDNANEITTITDANGTRSSNASLWWIPVPVLIHSNVVSNKRQYSIHWLSPNDTETQIQVQEFDSITNVEGYFRILYGKQELHSILKRLVKAYISENDKYGAYQISKSSPSLQAVERSQFLDDYFTFAFSNWEEVPVSLLFHIMSILLRHESERVVWNTFFQNIQKPYMLLRGTEYFSSFQKFIVQLLNPLHSFLNSQKSTTFSYPCFHSSVLTKRMRLTEFSAKVLHWLCNLDASSYVCANVAKEAVLKFMKTEDVGTILADEQSNMYCTAVKTAASKQELSLLWNFFEKMYFQEYFSVQRDRYLKALSCTQDQDYLLRLLEWTTNATLDFHDVDRVTLLKNVIANPTSRNLVLDFLDKNFVALYKSASVANPVTEAIKAYVDYINTKSKLNELETFITKHKEGMEKKKKFLEKQVRKAKLNILWMETFANDIQQSAERSLKTRFGQEEQACSYESVSDLDVYVSKITEW